jgi:hypothetical protein
LEPPPKPACFFCEATGRPLTNEHLWSAWLEGVLPDRGPITYYTAQALKGREHVDSRRWRGKDHSLTVKAVCAGCNNGWMSKLERDARPFLESMIRGRGRNLYRDGQRRVAAWAAMKAMLFQSKDRDAPIPLSHRRELYEHRRPPVGCQVWIGGFTGKVSAQRYYGLTINRPGSPPVPAYGSTFAVGHLVLQVFGHEANDGSRRQLGGQLARTLLELVPDYSLEVRWPPPVVMDDEALIEVSNTFARTPVL